MATRSALTLNSAPLRSAPGLLDYEQFKPAEIPFGSGAVEAYQGFVRPFSDDETARQVLRALEVSAEMNIAGGRLSVDAQNLPPSPWERFLINMAVPTTVLVLGFEGSEHHRAYLLEPRMEPRLSKSHHVREDRSIAIEGRTEPALCVYSGSMFRYSRNEAKLGQFLDQTSTYLAKHLVWLRTRMLFRQKGPGDLPELIRWREPEEKIPEVALLLSPKYFLHGYWPGPSAPSGPVQHLATINPGDECWCWSGKLYRNCCRPKDLLQGALPS